MGELERDILRLNDVWGQFSQWARALQRYRNQHKHDKPLVTAIDARVAGGEAERLLRIFGGEQFLAVAAMAVAAHHEAGASHALAAGLEIVGMPVSHAHQPVLRRCLSAEC